MLIEKAQPPDHSPTPILGSPTIAKMLIAKRYDQVDELLAQAQQSLRSSDDNPILDDILRAARQICLSCKVLHDTAEWHRWASQEASHQEQNLTELLQSISVIIDAENSTMLHKSTRNGTSKPPQNFWRRIQNVLLGQTSLTTPVIPTTHIPFLPTHPPNAKPTNSVAQAVGVSIQPSAALPTMSESATLPAAEIAHHHHTFVVYGLGFFRLYHNEVLIDNWSHRKAKTLFKYLLWHRQRPVAKEVLMDLFWPDIDADSARNNLNVTIYNLRQILRQSDTSCSYILFQNDAYIVNPDLNMWIDYEAFLDHCQNAKRLANNGHVESTLREMQAAESLYQGELFEDDPYDDWIAPQRHILHNHYVEILDSLSHHAFTKHEYAACISYCTKQLLVDSCREDAHRRLMQCYVALGQSYLAIRQYHTCVKQLKLNLDVAPSPKSVELYEGIRDAL